MPTPRPREGKEEKGGAKAPPPAGLEQARACFCLISHLTVTGDLPLKVIWKIPSEGASDFFEKNKTKRN